MIRCYLRTSALWTLTLLAGCAVGPDFKWPEAPDFGFIRGGVPADTSSAEGALGPVQHFAEGADVPQKWWEAFGSPQLDSLVERGLAHNADLEAAQATLRQSQELAKAAGGGLFPSIDAQFSPVRRKVSGAAFGAPNFPSSLFTLYNATVNVTYALDVFGGVRRQLETVQAQADAQRYLTEGTYLTLTANIVTAAIQEAAIREQIIETQRVVDIQNRQLGVLNQQFELGGVAKAPVLAQQATAAQSLANLPTLQKQLAQAHNQLAVLVGELPAEYDEKPFELAALKLPEELPLSLPSALVEHRPDIRSAGEQLHAASAQIGVATAAMLPGIRLTGSYGSQAQDTNRLFRASNEVWSVGADILQPVFRGGELLHEKRAAVAAYEAARARYRATVLLAFRNVADTLQALHYDADALKAQVDASNAAAGSLDLQQQQYQNGAVTYLSLLDAQRTYQQARIALVQAQAVRLADTVALFQALGGGWWNKGKTEKPQTEAATPSEESKEQAQ